MPCRDNYQDYKNSVSSRRANSLEVLLCFVCRILDEQSFDFSQNKALESWWKHHRKKDDARIKREKVEQLKQELASELVKKSVSELSKEDIVLLRSPYLWRGGFLLKLEKRLDISK